MTCSCGVNDCTNRPDCRYGSNPGPKRNQPTDRDGNAVRHGTRDKINRLRERLRGPRPDIVAILKGILDLLEDEL
jgi:hypothetical protein